MFSESRTVYRCSHCRRFTKFAARTVVAHEIHCRKNPNRTPFIGELTFAAFGGVWVDGQWLPYSSLPAWWPGSPGMIYTAEGWVPVKGYRNDLPDETTGYNYDFWPSVDGAPLDQFKPFWRRCVALGLPIDDVRFEWLTGREKDEYVVLLLARGATWKANDA